jgi:uncharacterized membrane-anchored protein
LNRRGEKEKNKKEKKKGIKKIVGKSWINKKE